MIRKLILTVIAFLLFTSVSISNPYLIAEPQDNATEWYILKINDNPEITVATNPLLDWNLFFSIHNLQEENTIIVQSADSFGDSIKIKFFIDVEIMGSFTRFTMRPDPKNTDPKFQGLFWTGWISRSKSQRLNTKSLQIKEKVRPLFR